MSAPELDSAELSHALDQLRESEARYRALAELSPVGTWVNLDGRFVYANAAAARMMRASSADELVGLSAFEIAIPEYRALIRERIAAVIEGGVDHLPPVETRWRRLDGTVFDVESRASAIPWQGRRAIQVVFHEITDRIRAAAELRAVRERLEAALATAHMACWDWDPSADHIASSASIADVYGLPPGHGVESIVTTFALVHPDDRQRHMALVDAAKRSGSGWHTRFRIIRPRDGAVAWLEERATVTLHPLTGAMHTTGLVWDITDRVRAESVAERTRAERERERLRWQLASAEEDERRRLARELHDEAGQHLTALGLGLQSLSDIAPAGSEVDVRVNQLRRLADRLAQDLHGLALRLRPKALDDFGLEAALRAFAEEWSRHTGITADVHVHLGAPRLPSAVESAVYRIVQEALTNVARHSGGSSASVHVERRDGQLVAIVEDNGRGFDATTVTSDADRGTALGLLGMRERVAMLGGSVEFETAAGSGGTTVYVRIPMESVGEPARRAARSRVAT